MGLLIPLPAGSRVEETFISAHLEPTCGTLVGEIWRWPVSVHLTCGLLTLIPWECVLPAFLSSLDSASRVSRREVRGLMERRNWHVSPSGVSRNNHRQWQLLPSGNFADSMRVRHDVTGTLAWPKQHGVQGSSICSSRLKRFLLLLLSPFSLPVSAIIVKPCSSFQK